MSYQILSLTTFYQPAGLPLKSVVFCYFFFQSNSLSIANRRMLTFLHFSFLLFHIFPLGYSYSNLTFFPDLIQYKINIFPDFTGTESAVKPSLKTNIISPRKNTTASHRRIFRYRIFLFFFSDQSESVFFQQILLPAHLSDILPVMRNADDGAWKFAEHFLMTGPDKGEKFRVGSSRISTLALPGSFSEAILFAFWPPDSSRMG